MPLVRLVPCSLQLALSVFVSGPMLVADTPAAAAQEWHVSPHGDDTARGLTLAEARRTIGGALADAAPGDTVLVHTGTYRETLRPPRSGRPGAPITITAAPGALVTVTACDVLEGPWTLETDGVWRTTQPAPAWPEDPGPGPDTGVSRGLNRLFVNGEPQTEARFPNRTLPGRMPYEGMAVRVDAAFQVESPALATLPTDALAGARFHGLILPAWTAQTGIVTGNRGTALQVRGDSVTSPWWPNQSLRDGGDAKRYGSSTGEAFVFGLRSLLDAPGEWVIAREGSTDTVWLRPPGDHPPSELTIERPTRPWTVELTSAEWIVIRGLRLVGGGVLLGGAHNRLEDGEVLHANHYWTFSRSYGADGGWPTGAAVRLQGANNLLQRCFIRDCAGSAVLMEGRDHLVIRNRIQDADYSGTYGTGIAVRGENQRVEFNTIRSVGRDGLTIAGGGHLIRYNDISRPNTIAHDGGAIYSYGQNGATADGRQTVSAYNWIHESAKPEDPNSMGIYLDNYSRGFVVTRNIVWNLGRPGRNHGIYVGSPSENIVVAHNTLLACTEPNVFTYCKFPLGNPDPAYWTVARNHLEITTQNNLVLPAALDPAGVLENPASGDFRPREGSTAIDPPRHDGDIVWATTGDDQAEPLAGYRLLRQKPDAPFRLRVTTGRGVPMPGLNDGFSGASPDDGAYERGDPLWRAGHDGFPAPGSPASADVSPLSSR